MASHHNTTKRLFSRCSIKVKKKTNYLECIEMEVTKFLLVERLFYNRLSLEGVSLSSFQHFIC